MSWLFSRALVVGLAWRTLERLRGDLSDPSDDDFRTR